MYVTNIYAEEQNQYQSSAICVIMSSRWRERETKDVYHLLFCVVCRESASTRHPKCICLSWSSRDLTWPFCAGRGLRGPIAPTWLQRLVVADGLYIYSFPVRPNKSHIVSALFGIIVVDCACASNYLLHAMFRRKRHQRTLNDLDFWPRLSFDIYIYLHAA